MFVPRQFRHHEPVGKYCKSCGLCGKLWVDALMLQQVLVLLQYGCNTVAKYILVLLQKMLQQCTPMVSNKT
jgi:hypothetical protein